MNLGKTRNLVRIKINFRDPPPPSKDPSILSPSQTSTINTCHAQLSLPINPSKPLFYQRAINRITQAFYVFDQLDEFLRTPHIFFKQSYCSLFFQYAHTNRKHFHPFSSSSYTILSNLCIWYSIHSPYTKQILKVVHLYIPNPKSFLLSPYHCLNLIH